MIAASLIESNFNQISPIPESHLRLSGGTSYHQWHLYIFRKTEVSALKRVSLADKKSIAVQFCLPDKTVCSFSVLDIEGKTQSNFRPVLVEGTYQIAFSGTELDLNQFYILKIELGKIEWLSVFRLNKNGEVI